MMKRQRGTPPSLVDCDRKVDPSNKLRPLFNEWMTLVLKTMVFVLPSNLSSCHNYTHPSTSTTATSAFSPLPSTCRKESPCTPGPQTTNNNNNAGNFQWSRGAPSVFRLKAALDITSHYASLGLNIVVNWWSPPNRPFMADRLFTSRKKIAISIKINDQWNLSVNQWMIFLI